jgi:hypothetical protein
MGKMAIDEDYSYVIVSMNANDRKTVLKNARGNSLIDAIVFGVLAVFLIVVLLFMRFSKTDLISYVCIILCSWLALATTFFVLHFLQAKKALQSGYKMVETGRITAMDAPSGDSEDTSYTYIGRRAYSMLPGNFVIGDRISVEHTVTQENKKSLYIRAEKLT